MPPGNFTDPHNHYTFTGQELDENMGLYEFFARAYDYDTGTWLQQDIYRGVPHEPRSLHRYSYVNANPVNWYDRFGFVRNDLLPDAMEKEELLKQKYEEQKKIADEIPNWKIWLHFLFGDQQKSLEMSLEKYRVDQYKEEWISAQENVKELIAEPSEWEQKYGLEISKQAHNILSNNDDYWVWGSHSGDDGGDKYPPPRRLPKQGESWGSVTNLRDWTGNRIPVVCADIPSLSYENAGFNLKQFSNWTAKYPNDPTRDVKTLKNLLDSHSQTYKFGETQRLPEVGDIVMTSSLGHSGVIVEVNGTDPSEIFLIQASYSKETINKMSLEDWDNEAYFGHPTYD
jgi:RHS repeat-associated protein